MRTYNHGAVCAYGLNNQAGHLFERSQNALRQRSFGRARGLMGKRFRDEHSDDSEEDRNSGCRPERRVVLDGFKRMRVSSPTESPKSDSDMTDEEVATPRTTWRTDKAIVPTTGHKRPLQFTTASAVEPWKALRQQGPKQPTDDYSCRAMVVFNPYQSMSLSPSPKIELVEDKETDLTSSSENEEEHAVRFEELSSDNEEPVDMDVD